MTDLKDSILKSPTGQRMLSRVSPIYDNSYVGLWLFEAIGQEYDELWQIMDEFPLQLFPETATWSLGLWERRYGLSVPSASSIEERRMNIKIKRDARPPMNPARIKSIAETITGGEVEILENYKPFCFRLTISDNAQVDRLEEVINTYKPAHMSCDIIRAFELGGDTTNYYGGALGTSILFVFSES